MSVIAGYVSVAFLPIQKVSGLKNAEKTTRRFLKAADLIRLYVPAEIIDVWSTPRVGQWGAGSEAIGGLLGRTPSDPEILS